jgi:preprotein translocase subunit SecD
MNVQLRWMVLLTVCLWINCSTLLAQRPTCPAIEVSVVADVQSDSHRSITLTEGQYVLNVDVTVESAERVHRFSERNVCRTLAFLVDGQVLRTPTIRDPITGQGFLIGPLERVQAERLADAVNTGCRR